MKALPFAVLVTLLVGCASQHPAQPPTHAEQAIALYRVVKASMHRDEVYRSLGKPQKTSPDGVEEWRTPEGPRVAVLSLRFGPDGKVSNIDFHDEDAGQSKPTASVAVTDLGTIALNDHDWYQCTLSGARSCRVRLTALSNGQVVVEVVVLSQDAQRILARAQTETDPGKKVSLGIGEGSVSLTPEITPGAKL